LSTPDPAPSRPPLSPDAQHFLRLLDDLSFIQETLLKERAELQARVRELEARDRLLQASGDGHGHP
jgi:hypothetical protein